MAGENLGIPAGNDLLGQLMQRMSVAQGNTAGMTTMGPQIPNVQVAQPAPHQDRPQQPARDMQTVGGRKRADMQNLGTTVGNIAGRIQTMFQERKARETQQTFDRFTQSVSGIQQAQAQVQEGQQMVQEGMKRQKANPEDPDAQEMLTKGAQMVQKAQDALKQNQTILNDMLNGPKGEKHAKMLAKGFGIDDKNAGTPERQAAQQAIKKSMGVSDRAASIISQMPQTQGLSPEGERQAMLQKAGVIGKPATGGQVMNAGTQMRGQDARVAMNALNNAARAGLAVDKMLPMMEARYGMTPVRDEAGKMHRNPDGSIQWRNVTPEERAKNPVLKTEDDLKEAKEEAQRAQADERMNPNNPALKIKSVEAEAKMLDAEARMKAAKAAMMRAQTQQTKEPPELVKAKEGRDAAQKNYLEAQERIKNPTAVGDTGLVMNWVKAQVAGAGRMTNVELEYAIKSGSLGRRYQNAWERATTGKFTPEYRQEVVDDIKMSAGAAQKIVDSYEQGRGQAKKDYENMSVDEFNTLVDTATH